MYTEKSLSPLLFLPPPFFCLRAPRSQGARAWAILLIPLGLCILGYVLSYVRAKALATPPKGSATTSGYAEQRVKELDAIFGDGDGELSREELEAQLNRSLRYSTSRLLSFCRLGTHNEIDDVPWDKRITISSFLWQTWDIYLHDRLHPPMVKGEDRFTAGAGATATTTTEEEKVATSSDVDNNPAVAATVATTGGKEPSFFFAKCTEDHPKVATAAALLLKVAILVASFAAFFKLYEGEDEKLHLTWIDSFYFAIVTISSIGCKFICFTNLPFLLNR